MLRLLLIGGLMLFGYASQAQVSDLISVRKKNGLALKTFMAGSPILLETKDHNYLQGTITAIKNDSVYLMMYDIRTVPTTLGVTVVDTFSNWVTGFPYTDILRIKIFTYRRFIRGKIARLLQFGGAGYFALNLINGAYFNHSVTDPQNVRSLGIAAGAFGLGTLINKLFPVNRFSRKHHRIVYVPLH